MNGFGGVVGYQRGEDRDRPCCMIGDCGETWDLQETVYGWICKWCYELLEEDERPELINRWESEEWDD